MHTATQARETGRGSGQQQHQERRRRRAERKPPREAPVNAAVGGGRQAAQVGGSGSLAGWAAGTSGQIVCWEGGTNVPLLVLCSRTLFPGNKRRPESETATGCSTRSSDGAKLTGTLVTKVTGVAVNSASGTN